MRSCALLILFLAEACGGAVRVVCWDPPDRDQPGGCPVEVCVHQSRATTCAQMAMSQDGASAVGQGSGSTDAFRTSRATSRCSRCLRMDSEGSTAMTCATCPASNAVCRPVPAPISSTVSVGWRCGSSARMNASGWAARPDAWANRPARPAQRSACSPACAPVSAAVCARSASYMCCQIASQSQPPAPIAADISAHTVIGTHLMDFVHIRGEPSRPLGRTIVELRHIWLDVQYRRAVDQVDLFDMQRGPLDAHKPDDR
jgi:hypothetical protein